MYYSEIKKTDVANCEGIGVSLFVSGCRNHCEGCFNPETWDFKYGRQFTKDTIDEILKACDKSYISTLTILGGDPMEKENRMSVLKLCKEFRKKFGGTKYLWLYTGYFYEDLIKEDTSLKIIKTLDVMIDSPFVLSKKVVGLKLRGSTNQRIIDIKKSLDSNKVIDYQFKTF